MEGRILSQPRVTLCGFGDKDSKTDPYTAGRLQFAGMSSGSLKACDVVLILENKSNGSAFANVKGMKLVKEEAARLTDHVSIK